MRRTLGVMAVVALLGIVITGYVLFNRETESLPDAQEFPSFPTVVAVRPPTPTPPAPTESAIRHPLDAAPATESLAELGNGDALLLEVLGHVLGQRWLTLIAPDELIRHIVVTVDQLPRQSLSASIVPLKRVQGGFKTAWNGEALSIDPNNAVRYASYVRLIQSVDTAKLVSAYRKFYPWFQHAYEELGYPKAYFNDRLVETIDDLLATPELEESPKLIQPKVLYEFADPELQARSVGQKIMIRMGKENADQIKAKLREIRRQLTLTPGIS
jgi:hypothetical protein